MKRAPALDRIDVKILAELQRDGRSTIQKLAETIGLSRVPRWSGSAGWRRQASSRLSGRGRASAAVTAGRHLRRDHPGKARQSRPFQYGWRRSDEVVECWEVSGDVDYLVRFVCADLAGYEEVTSALIDDTNLGVARIVSHVALRATVASTLPEYPGSLLARKVAKVNRKPPFRRASGVHARSRRRVVPLQPQTLRRRPRFALRISAPIRRAACVEPCHESHRTRPDSALLP
jgi:DNA-binding Lrp family transcriptional regulator